MKAINSIHLDIINYELIGIKSKSNIIIFMNTFKQLSNYTTTLIYVGISEVWLFFKLKNMKEIKFKVITKLSV